MKIYESLFKQGGEQDASAVFAHFHKIDNDWDGSYAKVAKDTWDGVDAWHFKQERFKAKYAGQKFPKLKNYLNYTFKRLADLEQENPNEYFVENQSDNQNWISFNTGLQNRNGLDLFAIFERYEQREGQPQRVSPDWVFKGCYPSRHSFYQNRFGTRKGKISWYSKDSRDFVYNLEYKMDKDISDHLIERARERVVAFNSSDDELIRNGLRGALEHLVPKIERNYKVAIPMFHVKYKCMQILLPFGQYSEFDAASCFVVERDDGLKMYRVKTIFDLDKAYYAARLITRPDREWLNP